jgi:hypothetical protein
LGEAEDIVSATVSPDRPTRARAPGGSFICPYTSAHFEPAVEPLFFFGSLFTPESMNS